MLTRHLLAGLAFGAALLVAGCCHHNRCAPAVVGAAPVGGPCCNGAAPGGVPGGIPAPPAPVNGVPPTGAFAPPN